MTEAERVRLTDEWTAWLARPIAEREAIQDKVHATFEVCGIQAGRDMAKANGMPTPPADLVIPSDVLEARRELEGERDDDGLWKPVGRMDH